MAEKSYQNLKIETLPESKMKISGEVTEKVFSKARQTALEHAKLAVEVPGFRAGKAPEAIVLKHVGEMRILEQAAESAINETYGEIIDDQKIRAIGMPHVSITKIAAGNPLGFIIETAVMPEISFKNYKELAKEALKNIPEAETKVEDKEIDSVIEDLRKRMGKEVDDKKELPEINDEFVKKFGDFANVEAFKKQITENLLEHKKHEAKDKRRAAVAEKIIAEAKFDVPKIIVDSELDTMVNHFRADVEKSGQTFEGYLKHVKKTEAEIRKEWTESATRRAKLELLLKHIGREEKISLSEEEIKEKVDHILSHHKDADRFRVRMFVENMMTNDKVLEFLEQK